jgi:hypothetical protein
LALLRWLLPSGIENVKFGYLMEEDSGTFHKMEAMDGKGMARLAR